MLMINLGVLNNGEFMCKQLYVFIPSVFEI